MESFKEYLKEVNPHNIQRQIAALKKGSTAWSGDDLTHIIDCILERVSLDLPDMDCLYLYTCRMMIKFEGKVRTRRHHASVAFQDVLQKRVNHQLGKRLEAEKRKSQQRSNDDWKHWRELDSFCSFLGRLFVHDVLTSETLLFCIGELVKHDTETSWLLISKMLKDLMFHLERHRMLHNFDPVFQKMYEMIQENHLSVGTSFMLCDLYDVKAKYQKPVETRFYTFDKIRQESSMGQEKNDNVQKVAMRSLSSRADLEDSIPQHNEQSGLVSPELVRREAEDQWTPINPQGRKKYDRNFLLTIQPECTIRPKGLPDIPDIILEMAHVRRRFSFTSGALKSDESSDEAMNLTSLMQQSSSGTPDIPSKTFKKEKRRRKREEKRNTLQLKAAAARQHGSIQQQMEDLQQASSGTPDIPSKTLKQEMRRRRRKQKRNIVRLKAAAARQHGSTQQQIKNLQKLINTVETAELQELVLQLLLRYPALFFDIWERQLQPPTTVAEDEPGWCTCGQCREMPTMEEQVCCLGSKDNCLSLRPEVDTVVINPLVLGVARTFRADIFGDNREVVGPNTDNRHAAYRQFLLWHNGHLGNRNRRVIPSCVVWRIRDTFPDPYSNYEGYIPGRLM